MKGEVILDCLSFSSVVWVTGGFELNLFLKVSIYGVICHKRHKAWNH